MSSSQVVIPQGTYPASPNRSFGPWTVPAGVDHMRLGLTTLNMTDPALVVSLALDLRLSAGDPWSTVNPANLDPFPYPAEFHGGRYNEDTGVWEVGQPISGKTKQIIAELFAEIPVPHPELATRQIRGTIGCNLPLTTLGTLYLLP